MSLDLATIEKTRQAAAAYLLKQRNAHGWWEGRLASSALSTATAITALKLVQRERHQSAGRSQFDSLVTGGVRWLIAHQNDDGGWGDTTRSLSNISTTTLGWAALGLVADDLPDPALTRQAHAAAEKAERWLADYAGSVEPGELSRAIAKRYGKDRTFSVPIVTMSVLCGRLGEGRAAWRHVVQLPFELAAFPQAWFRYLKLPVVSYALPALIAMGLVRHHYRPTRNPLTWAARWLTRRRVLRVLRQIQPSNGGFLEATPLTSFVTMSLAGAGLADHAVAKQGVAFLVDSVRDDGSWPIDTNLATWCTTLSVNALAAGGRLEQHLDAAERERILQWLVDQQYRRVHPYTGAPPGGWAWTDLPGGVPDADDTSGALTAIAELADRDDRRAGTLRPVGENGLIWLDGLQNADGGIPTFCRGWGTLPFDRSCADITGHALRACAKWHFSAKAIRIAREGQRFLHDTQAEDGAWRPLWFGNQHQQTEENPTYGTSRVVLGLLAGDDDAQRMAQRGAAYLLTQQNDDGGWGGERGTPSSIEETALALEAITATLQTLGAAALNEADASACVPASGKRERPSPPPATQPCDAALQRGLAWLISRTDHGTRFEPSPMGFYFAKLWYYETLYPMVWTVAALERAAAYLHADEAPPARPKLRNTGPEASGKRKRPSSA